MKKIQFKPIVTVDHKCWNYENLNYDMKEIGLLGTEFRVTLIIFITSLTVDQEF